MTFGGPAGLSLLPGCPRVRQKKGIAVKKTLLSIAVLTAALPMTSEARQTRPMGSGDPILAYSPVSCRVGTTFNFETVTSLDGKISLRDFSLKFICGKDPKGLSAKELRKETKECREKVASFVKVKLGEIPKEELEAKLKSAFAKLPGHQLDFAALLKKGEAVVANALLDPNKFTEMKGEEKESSGGSASLSEVLFAPIAKRFGLIPIDSEEGKSLEKRWFRVVELEGVRYYEPSYGGGEFHLGRVSNIAAAKNLFIDATEVLVDHHAMIGETQASLYIGGSEKTDVRARVLAVRRSNGETSPVIQILKAPRRERRRNGIDRGDMNMEKIEIVRQLVVPVDGKTHSIDLLKMPELAGKEKVSEKKKTTGSYVLSASCVARAIPMP